MQKAEGKRQNILRIIVAAVLAMISCAVECLDCQGADQTDKTVVVQVLDFEGLQKLIASKKEKIVVMDCWATSVRAVRGRVPQARGD